MREVMNTRSIAYEAILSNTNNLARVNATRHAIEQIGGKMRVAPIRAGGMTLVTLALPDTYTPDKFFPGLPFYPSTQG